MGRTGRTSYDVLRSGQRIATVTGKTFTDIGLLPNTPYLYSVRANGTTTPELTATVGSTPSTPPDQRGTDQHDVDQRRRHHHDRAPPAGNGTPSNLAVASTTPTSISLKWDGGAGHSYQVLRSGIPIGTVTTNTFTDIGLLPNTPYLYSIRGNGVTTRS